jgi:CHAD domain-containing protein
MPGSKWIRLKSLREKVHRVAARMLRSRLEAIVHYLPLAAKRAEENVEYVHQLRVWTRRTDAVLDLCGKLFSKHERKRLGEQLDLLRDAAGSARDLDVLQERITALKPGLARDQLTREAEQCRRAAQKGIQKACSDLRNGKLLLLALRAIVKRLHRKGKKAPLAKRFDHWGVKRVQRLKKRFFKLAKKDLKDLSALHKFRIAGKRLRYALELVGDCFKRAPRKRAYAALDRLQMQLGAINDWRNLTVEIERALEGAKKRTLQTQLKRLLAAEHRRLAAAQAVWEGQWNEREHKRLRRAFDKCE